MVVERKFRDLMELLGSLDRAVIAFSGGLDSSLLLYLALEAMGRDNVLAITIDFPYIPRNSIENACRVARDLGVRHIVIRDNEVMKERDILLNTRNRCYVCKKRMYRLIKEKAMEYGVEVVLDGTNTSDLGEYRPGIRALREEGVCCPFIDVGIAKDDIREYVVERDLPFKQVYRTTCLLTRFPYRYLIIDDELKLVEEVEQLIIKCSGVGFVRARFHGDCLRVETHPDSLSVLVEKLRIGNCINKIKQLGFKYVVVDCEGYHGWE